MHHGGTAWLFGDEDELVVAVGTGNVLLCFSALHVCGGRVLQLYGFLLFSYNYGFGNTMEFYNGNGGWVLTLHSVSSFTMAMVDGYSLFIQCPLRQPSIIVIIVVGDWVLSMLSLAAACATASSLELLLKIDGQFCAPKFCSRYELSAAMAFMSWILTGASSLSNLWILASW